MAMRQADPDLKQFLEDRAPALLRLALVITPTRSAAEDLTHDALVRLIRHWARVRKATDRSAYARRVLINESIRRAPSNHITVPIEETPTAEQGYDAVDSRDEAERMLQKLPARQRAAVAMRYLEDCDYQEIAAALKCRESTARSLVKRGLDALRFSPTHDSQIDGRNRA